MPESVQGKTLELTVTKAAKLIGVSASTLRRYEEQGKITSKRLDNGYRKFLREDVLNLKRELEEERQSKEPEKVTTPKIIAQSPTLNLNKKNLNKEFQQIKQPIIVKTPQDPKHITEKNIFGQNLALKHGLNKRVSGLLAGISIISSIAVLGLVFLMAPQATRNQITESGKHQTIPWRGTR